MERQDAAGAGGTGGIIMFDNRKIGQNLREGGFLAVCLILIYLLITLATYSKTDPSFSTTLESDIIANSGGIFGAYVSSMLFELFGRSSYLLCLIICIFGWVILLRPAVADDLNRVAWWAAGIGVILFMLSSSSLEYLRFHYTAGLPAAPGGLTGYLLAPVMSDWFGEVGASIILVAIWLLSWSLAAGLSWFAFLELIGKTVEHIGCRLLTVWQRQQENNKADAADAERKMAITSAVKKKRGEKSAAQKEPTIQRPPTIKKPPRQAAAPTATTAATAATAAPAMENALPLPDMALLDMPEANNEIDETMLTRTSEMIERSLADFNIKATVTAAHPGPVITRYDIQPATGVKGAQVVNLARDLARALSISSIRVLENIPGTNYIGLEIPNPKRSTVALSEILSSDDYSNSRAALPLALGKTAAGATSVVDLAAMPHLLVAGATGAGKSVFINSMLLSLLYARTPAQLRLLLIDPKMLELAIYADIPHLLAPVVTDMDMAPAALHWAVEEMETRYRKMATTGVRHIQSYNEAAAAGKIKDEDGNDCAPMPYIAVIIDELADMMMVAGKKVEISISRLAQKARAAGIHIVLATQRPSVDVITGLIKANIPCRLSFQVASKIDSRTVLDQMGAETLLGKGDMLYLPSGAGVPQRLHGAFVSDDEVRRVVEHIHRQSGGRHEYLTDFSEAMSAMAASGSKGGGNGGNGEEVGDGEQDPLYDQAVETVIESNRASISLVQRKLRIGYNRAARLIEAMEAAGLVTPMNDYGVRKVIKK